MTKHDKKKLSLSTQTIRALDGADLGKTAGGTAWTYWRCSVYPNCPIKTPQCPI